MRMLFCALTLLYALPGCGGCSSRGGEKPPSSAAPAVGTGRAKSVEPTGPAALQKQQEAIDSQNRAAVAVVVRGVPDKGKPGRIGIEVQNRHRSTVKLATEVVVQRHTPDGWKPFAASGVSLRLSCDSLQQDCIELVPGAELFAPAWHAASGPAQCGCDGCQPAPSGRYRFLIRGCNNGFRIQSEPFAIEN